VEFTFLIGEIGGQIQVTDSQLKLGENFRITVAGMSADDWNTRSTRFSGVANAEAMVMRDLLWATTVMACVKSP
jgi:hypothetical protein